MEEDTISVRVARLLCPLFTIVLAACGGGGGGGNSETTTTQPVVERVWQQLPGGGTKGFSVCGPGIVRTTGLSSPATSISYDHGVTWQSVDLASASVELGDSGYYFGGGRPPNFPRSELTWETGDCGHTWKAFPPQLQACGDGASPVTIWREGTSNQIVHAQFRDPLSTQFFICTSADQGQTWLRGATIPAQVGEVRHGYWFAWQAVAPVTTGTFITYLLLRSHDQGASWQADGLRSTANSFPTTYYGARLAPSPPVLYLMATMQAPGAEGLGDENLWRWDDAAATWSAAPSPLPLAAGTHWDHSPAANPANSQQVFLMTERHELPPGLFFTQRVFETRDAGRTWNEVTNGVFKGEQNFAIFDAFLAFDPGPTHLLLAVHYFSSIWALDARY